MKLPDFSLTSINFIFQTFSLTVETQINIRIYMKKKTLVQMF